MFSKQNGGQSAWDDGKIGANLASYSPPGKNQSVRMAVQAVNQDINKLFDLAMATGVIDARPGPGYKCVNFDATNDNALNFLDALRAKARTEFGAESIDKAIQIAQGHIQQHAREHPAM